MTDTPGWATLQRVIFPPESGVDTMSLYADAGPASGVRMQESNEFARNPKPLGERLHLVGASPKEVHFDDLVSRHSIRVRSGEQLSLGTYFNAFPASYWRRWTHVRQIRLVVETSGHGSVTVYKSNARGTIQRVEGARLDGDTTTAFELSIKPFGDGGWYWFDLASSRGDLVLKQARWEGPQPLRSGERATIQITTMDKPDFCLANIRSLVEHPDALELAKEVIIVDQGSRKVAHQPGFAEVAELFGPKLRVIDQANLGGSGGFARGMYEAVENGSDYVLLLDDDVVMEPESIMRMMAFSGRCKNPTIVGGHMFDLYSRSTLYSMGETIDARRFSPGQPHQDMQMRHDFGVSNLRQTPWLHRRVDVDYNGWWMCLIPTSVIRTIGLPLPVFIKWDDSEYGLRARAAGIRTVSLPGAALWHISWIDKDDLVGWQAYFHNRNRLITALLHSPYPKGGNVLRESFQEDVKHLVSLQYFTAHNRLAGRDDLLTGPGHLHPSLSTKLAEINELRESYSDATMREDVDDFPAPALGAGLSAAADVQMPAKKDMVQWGLTMVARQLMKQPPPESLERPQAYLAHLDNRWFRIAHYDSVVVSNAEGTAASWYRRDPKKLRAMLTRSTRQHARLYKDWNALADNYRSALPALVSMEAWRATFDAAAPAQGHKNDPATRSAGASK
ncbi:glycosyltransferase [Pseudarthrobacter sp. GA104]|uniref:glycosyltransferase n=1 Tax=Pseudarthrobacter sp. GA104 TaxID=2676311 RepID=UPI0012FBB0BE|nr:glycosyltransferase [Pseudarthrobacter sp. GA104]MUU72928.1 glycosyltransferase [Pseudarthrobacter sp. GA104]